MHNYIKLIRVEQWLKNVFIFAPMFFSLSFNTHNIIQLVWAFFGFSFIASTVYIINDWKDIESDRIHPTKKNRPLAAGKIKTQHAFILLFILLITGIFIYAVVLKNITALGLVLTYLCLNIAYCFKLKQISIIDISIVSIGFVIRLFIGSSVTGIDLSYWIIIITFLLSMLLVIGKRRSDVIILNETGKRMRKSITGYNLEFVNSLIIIIVSTIIISYILYTISPKVVEQNGEYLYITSLFVIMGLFRYLQSIFVEKKGDSPTKLLIKDRFLQIYILLWASSFFVISVINHINSN